jgi:3-methyladenine DNA glycosylase AlkC
MLPHLAVIGFAAIAVATGVARYAVEPYMPLLSFLLNIFWVCVVAAIAVAAVRFAVGRNRQVRDTYRFRLPVPVVIRWPGEMPRALVTDDISSNGMRLRVPWSRPISPSTEMDAELILPSGRQPVRMQVERSWRDSGLHSVGFSFRWPSREGADMLDIYLYGSNAEWLMNGLLERSTTPLGKLSRLFGRGHRPRLLGQSWRTALVLPSDFSLSALCLVSEDQDDGGLTLLASRPLPLQSIALILPGDHSKVQPYRISTTDIDQSDGQPWYLHRLVARELAKDEFIEWAESIPPRVAAVA